MRKLVLKIHIFADFEFRVLEKSKKPKSRLILLVNVISKSI